MRKLSRVYKMLGGVIIWNLPAAVIDKEEIMAGGPFDKDFGYLMPFLDKVAAAANALPDQAAREELSRLMADQKSRWNRIRALLAGAAGSQAPINSAQPAQAAASSSNAASSAAANAASNAPVKEAFSFTVGSLRRRS